MVDLNKFNIILENDFIRRNMFSIVTIDSNYNHCYCNDDKLYGCILFQPTNSVYLEQCLYNSESGDDVRDFYLNEKLSRLNDNDLNVFKGIIKKYNDKRLYECNNIKLKTINCNTVVLDLVNTNYIINVLYNIILNFNYFHLYNNILKNNVINKKFGVKCNNGKFRCISLS